MPTRLSSALWISVLVALLITVACGQSAAPGTSPAPSQSTPASSAASPAQSAPASAKPSASPDSKARWDSIVAAAKKEGKVVVAGGRGELYQNSVTPFHKAFPEIQVEYTGVQAADFSPKIIAERDGGQYLWDVHIGGTTTALATFKAKGMLDPLKPSLILPEVLDDSKWINGFEDGWIDNDHKYIFGFEARRFFIVYVNRDKIPESELNSIDQLLDPKWKGKIAIGELRQAGSANGAAGFLLAKKGEEWLRKLFAQDLVITKDERLLAESVVRGSYPIIMGINAASIEPFKQQGAANSVKALTPDAPDGAAMSSGFGNLMLFTKAPHPNAAILFANWLLSADGQKSYAAATSLSTRNVAGQRADEYTLKSGVNYFKITNEDGVQIELKALDIAKQVFK